MLSTLFSAGSIGEILITLFLVVLLMLIGFMIYFMPTIISFRKKQSIKLKVLFWNLITCWSLLGWIICLVVVGSKKSST